MARGTSGSPGVFVTALTVLAFAVVGFFAYQASAAPDRERSGPAAPAGDGGSAQESGETGTAGAGGPAGSGETGEAGESGDPAAVAPLPEDSGAGRRVVYSLSERRVWLVETAEDGLGDRILHTYPVFHSSVDPAPGEYRVNNRYEALNGSDGVPIENVVVFAASEDGVVFGFSTATDGSVPDPESPQRTGGIRQPAEDGTRMWEFATTGMPVVVTP
ncbi:L,D-transpeptidase [Streptomyces aidingensis]|uniref:L,D-transpeptidase catalytic domain n=1 Tax=Streptomyces aidingensis TaxID=910347 RepID=A0A1I1EA20_9ACTN|nr:L,D-transpeptidase [Streptomyces aidingensis]SFB83566.1 hypothetical protein SAMN05421773_101194 [Streptomyces aidingensis]